MGVVPQTLPAWAAEEAANPAAVAARMKTRGVSLESEEITLLGELLARFPDGASPPGMLAGMQSAGGRSLQAAD